MKKAQKFNPMLLQKFVKGKNYGHQCNNNKESIGLIPEIKQNNNPLAKSMIELLDRILRKKRFQGKSQTIFKKKELANEKKHYQNRTNNFVKQLRS